ncbi:hypothetical protein [Oscillibacter sp.]|uniref:hypothetical protein n=1 Tax=Oscillibacter sp. TaxID=1945593 RepID=UPI00289E4702|nr:hypothetical protein [Oscillibacter sp.]
MSELERERQDILALCEQAKRKDHDIQCNSCHPIIKKMAQSISSRISNINRYCSPKSYNIFFNGKIAVGKSTAICTLLSLIDTKNKNLNIPLSDVVLLKTGTGRITVCETKIIPRSAKSVIIIEPVLREDFEAYLTQFSQWLSGGSTDISQEHIRLIKNMAGIPQKFKSPDDLMENYSELKINPLEYLKEKINYNNRTKLLYEKGEIDFEAWIKNTFEKINDGQFSDSPMPKRITVQINNDDYQLDLPEYISSIIDTRGVDLGERADIQDYMAQEDSISFMCDKVNDLGSNESVMSILQQVLIKENKDTRLRVGFVCLSENGELENITDCDTREEGMSEKKEQLRKKLCEREVSLDTKNIIFYESAKGFTFDDKRIVSFEKDIARKERDNFFDEVDKLIGRMYFNYRQELLTALETLSGLEQGIITDSILKKFRESKNAVSRHKSSISVRDDAITSKFKDAIMTTYHSSLRGAVNHNGSGWTADVYASFKKCGGQEFADNCKELKGKLVATIEQIFINSSDLERLCLESIIQKIDDLYSEYYTKARNSSFEIAQSGLYNDLSWSNPKRYWGDGLGQYNARVCSDILAEIKQKKVNEKLLQLKLENSFFGCIDDFLNIV